MKSTYFDAKNLPARPAQQSASAKPPANNSEFEDDHIFADGAKTDGDIDEISERLVTLAHQINEANTARRTAGMPARAMGSYMPSFLRALAKEPRQWNSDPMIDFGISRLSGASEPSIKAARPFDVDADGRLWPQLPVPKKSDVQALEANVEALSAELDRHKIEVADLSNLKQSQTIELVSARAEIECLRKSVAEFQQMAAENEIKAIEAAQKLIRSDGEKAILRAQLDDGFGEAGKLSQQLLDAQAALNDKAVDIAAFREAIEQLKAALQAARAETIMRVAQAEAKADLQLCEEQNVQVADYEKRIGWVHALVEDRDRHIERLEMAFAELGACCDGLNKKVLEFEDAQGQAETVNQAQTAHIEFLETVMKIERENAEAKIKELVLEFQRERLKYYVKEQASAEIRKNIVQLLPILAARKEAHDEAEADSSALQTQVA